MDLDGLEEHAQHCISAVPCGTFLCEVHLPPVHVSFHPATDVNNLTDCSLSLSKEESVSDEEEGEEHGN